MFTSATIAHNLVVVVPLAGDDLKPLKNIITVAKENGDFASPVTAMNSIMDADEDNPYLIVIAPGVYTLTSQQIVMKEYVDIAGSGQNVTILNGSKSSATASSSAAVVVGANNASISDLSIKNIDSIFSISTYAIGIFNEGVLPTISDVRIEVTAGKNFQYGIRNVGNYDYFAPAIISGVTISVTGAINSQTGVFNTASSNPILSNVLIDVAPSSGTSYGVYNEAASDSVTISNSLIKGDTASVRAFTGFGYFESYISNTTVIGAVSGDPKCVFVFKTGGVDLDSSCQ